MTRLKQDILDRFRNEGLITFSEAASKLDVSIFTIRSYVAKGWLREEIHQSTRFVRAEDLLALPTKRAARREADRVERTQRMKDTAKEKARINRTFQASLSRRHNNPEVLPTPPEWIEAAELLGLTRSSESPDYSIAGPEADRLDRQPRPSILATILFPSSSSPPTPAIGHSTLEPSGFQPPPQPAPPTSLDAPPQQWSSWPPPWSSPYGSTSPPDENEGLVPVLPPTRSLT